MATGYITFTAADATVPDGSAGNAAPSILVGKAAGSNPVPFFLYASFDSTTAEHLWFTFQMPGNYASGGVLDLQWTANTTSGSVVWGVGVAAITAGDVDTPFEKAPAASTTATTAVNGTEARRLIVTSIAPGMDSAAAGDLIIFKVYRDAANGSDTCTVDAELITIRFSYTTS